MRANAPTVLLLQYAIDNKTMADNGGAFEQLYTYTNAHQMICVDGTFSNKVVRAPILFVSKSIYTKLASYRALRHAYVKPSEMAQNLRRRYGRFVSALAEPHSYPTPSFLFLEGCGVGLVLCPNARRLRSIEFGRLRCGENTFIRVSETADVSHAPPLLLYSSELW